MEDHDLVNTEVAIPAWAAALIRLTIAVIMATVIVFAVRFGFERAAEALPIGDYPALAESAVTLILFGMLALVATVGLQIARERPVVGDRAGSGVALGIGLGVSGVAIALSLATIAGVIHAGVTGSAIGLLLPLGTLLTLFQTGVEEYYFRGWLQPALQRGWGRWPGLAASAAAFAVLHLVGGATTNVSLVSITLAGLWFGLLAERSGGLALPIGAHFGWNWAEEMLFGAAPNPGIGSYGALIDLDLSGALRWSGGDEGLNASLAGIFVLVALIVLTVAWPREEATVSAVPLRA
ncbi:CPBP family intramembrane glutamic endopeptidase [Sphingomonas radiodurans]|uniref:CPBP family intramembrane glutamic endopeptidase n=1 Tax=Sphingomonas radiodurans TaxID=2890321 RepID=UPI001E4E473F|nr:type II CAAX endopeptidase family protein [Sphingomonas radiodurans]WBH16457.1 type II CAAX endopeptidase family protein [Sphingomonas radiodurans]